MAEAIGLDEIGPFISCMREHQTLEEFGRRLIEEILVTAADGDEIRSQLTLTASIGCDVKPVVPPYAAEPHEVCYWETCIVEGKAYRCHICVRVPYTE